MFNNLCALIILTLFCVCVRAKLLNQVLNCVDPETGLLHPPNSTWPSTKSCRAYACKIRRKNITSIEFVPMEKVNHKTEEKFRNVESNIPNIDGINRFPTKKPEANVQSVFSKENKLFDKEQSDRYLTESEIKTISDALYTVKKSDLEAIMEIYNLAQDLYKTMDKESSVRDVTEEALLENYLGKGNNIKSVDRNSLLANYLLQEDNTAKTTPNADMQHAGTNENYYTYPNYRLATHYDYRPQYNTQAYSVLPEYHVIPYTTASLPKFDSVPFNIAKLVYTTPPHIFPIDMNNIKLPDKHQLIDKEAVIPVPQVYYPLHVSRLTSMHSLQADKSTPMLGETQKHRHSRPLLPYPFLYMQRSNTSYPVASSYNKIPLNVMTGKKQKTYIESSHLYNLVKSSDSKNATDIIGNQRQKGMAKKNNKLFKMISNLDSKEDLEDERKFPSWQTAPLSDSTLEEIRANMPKKTIWYKTFPLRKKIQLEKVGNAINFDDLGRMTRSIEKFGSDDEKAMDVKYETYLEINVCESDLEPGFFRLGNTSLPYPACCPQRIELPMNKKK